MMLIMETVLRKIGHSKGLILPAKLLKELNFQIGDKLNATAVNGKLVIELAEKRPKYKLADLLAKCDLSEQAPQELAEWDNQPLVGNEA